MSKRSSYVILRIFCFYLLAVDVCRSISIGPIEVPSWQPSGEQLTLKCEYDLSGAKLVSVEWSLNSKPFFLSEGKTIKTFMLEGMTVDKSLSNSTDVYLEHITWKASGRYACLVEFDQGNGIEASSIETDMTVIYFPESEPTITGSLLKYAVGDEVNVNCTSSKSWPEANLRWSVNFEEVPDEQLVHYEPEKEESGLLIATKGLRFTVTADQFPYDMMRLQCGSTIWNLSPKSSEAIATERNHGSIARCDTWTLVLLIGLVLLVQKSSPLGSSANW